MIDINLTGVFHTCKATVAHVRRRGPGGAFVLVRSDVGMKPIGGLSHYVAAKIGVRSLAQSLAKELGSERIRANSLHPGPINGAPTGYASPPPSHTCLDQGGLDVNIYGAWVSRRRSIWCHPRRCAQRFHHRVRGQHGPVPSPKHHHTRLAP
jgi:NAD(P)-dependent dehydrogenase (short-subunit alcohol dehydrogenase family)